MMDWLIVGGLFLALYWLNEALGKLRAIDQKIENLWALTHRLNEETNSRIAGVFTNTEVIKAGVKKD